MRFKREYYGPIKQEFKFNMPFHWNNDEGYWTELERFNKRLEMESDWRDYFASSGNKTQSNKSYFRAQDIKRKIELAAVEQAKRDVESADRIRTKFGFKLYDTFYLKRNTNKQQ